MRYITVVIFLVVLGGCSTAPQQTNHVTDTPTPSIHLNNSIAPPGTNLNNINASKVFESHRRVLDKTNYTIRTVAISDSTTAKRYYKIDNQERIVIAEIQTISENETEKFQYYFNNGTLYLNNESGSETMSVKWWELRPRIHRIDARIFVYGPDFNATNAYLRNGTRMVRFTGSIGNDSVRAARTDVSIDHRGVVRSGNMTLNKAYAPQRWRSTRRLQLDIWGIGSTRIQKPKWVTQMSD